MPPVSHSGCLNSIPVLTAGFAANTGHDVAGAVFGLAYQDAAGSLSKAMAAAINACRHSGALIQQGASNYSKAEAASTLGGGAGVLQAPAEPANISDPGPPGTLGPGQPPPLLWAVVESFVDDVWPDADVGGLRAAAARWRSFAGAASGMQGALNAAQALLDAQQIPEGGKVDEALSQIGDCIAQIGDGCGKLATALDDFANEVDHAQNAIRDLLHRLGSLTDLGHDVMLIVKGDALDEIKKIARDINDVLHDLGREARAFEQGIKVVMRVGDGLVVKLERFMRGQFTHFLGEPVGNAVATNFDFLANTYEGLVKGAVGTVQGMVDLDPRWFLLDPQGASATWAGIMKASPINAFINPQEAGEACSQQFRALLHLDDWSTARPGLGFGENLFDVGMFFIPGVGEAGGAAEGAGAAARGAEAAADAAGTAERGGAGAAGGVAGLAGSRGALSDIAKTSGDMTRGLEGLTGNLPKIDPPLGGRPVGLPAPKPLEAPVESVPHPPDAAPGAPQGPTTPPGPTPPEPPPGPAGDPPAPAPAPVGGPHEPIPATAPGSPPPAVPAVAGERIPSAIPQLAEPSPAPVPVSPRGSPGEPAAAAHSPQAAPSSPTSATPHFASPGGRPPELSAPGSGWHGPGDGGPPGGRSLGKPPHGGGPHGPGDGGPPGDHGVQGSPSEEPPVEGAGGVGEIRHTISGHGDYLPAHGHMNVPPGTTITIYAEHGSTITNALGNLIETGGDTSGVYSETFLPGEQVPDYTIHPPDGLNIMGAPQTVDYPMRLSELIDENMGPVDLAVCTYDETSPTGKIYHVDGIFDEWTGIFQSYER